MKQVVSKRDDVVFYLKMYPLVSIHKDSYAKSTAIICALDKGNDEALKLLEDAYARKPIPEATCKTTVVDDDMKFGQEKGFSSTPTIVFQNGKVVSGAIDEQSMNSILDQQ